MIDIKLRPSPTYPVYPPYHTGMYLEEYFFDFYQKNIERFKILNRQYIPIFWTNCYVNGVQEGWGDRLSFSDIQSEINKLDPKLSYFTVCQHDDAPMNPIPQDTVVFSAGGNAVGTLVAPIPLLCGPLLYSHLFSTSFFHEQKRNKTLLASFVGSNTHDIRNKMVDALKDKDGVYISTKVWEQNVQFDQFTDFMESSLRSKFVLCPRGYGASSFRIYEAMQLDAIPVYISDRFWLPWLHELNWNEFCVLIKEEQIPDLHSILESIDDETYEKMKQKIKEVYENYFTLEGTCNKILQMLEKENT